MFEKYIDSYKYEMIRELQKIISVRSVSEDCDDENNMPFGKKANEALVQFLELADRLGFRTKNVDGYCGYAEFGEGEDLVGIIGHLDVVPEGEGWSYPPFSGTVQDGKIYGRGAIDDKGPVISSLYAMKAVMSYVEDNNLSLNKRVRLIVGLDEETDWKCIEYYKEHEEIPSVSFSPDADFPCIYAEKGVLTEHVEMDYAEFLGSSSGKIVIESIDDDDNKVNVVPKFCRCVLKLDTDAINQVEALRVLEDLYDGDFLVSDSSDFELSCIGNDRLEITSYGVQAHAAHPDMGVNAISNLLVLLYRFFQIYDVQVPLLSFFGKNIGTDFTGDLCGISCEDESGNLTLNVGQLKFDDNKMTIGLNLRVPVFTDLKKVHSDIEMLVSNYSYLKVLEPVFMEPLYISKDNDLVKTLCGVYNEVTGSNEEPIAIGGATFARAFPNCVSFGANLPGQKDMCHQTDEFITVDNLILACEVYARAIKKLVL